MLKMVNFHGHSSYSPQDAIMRPEEYPGLAKMLNVESIGISEHANISSWLDFQAACKKSGIKPILGCEYYFYWSEDPLNRKSHHLLLVVKNEQGWKSMIKLLALSNTPMEQGGGFYYRPRINEKMLFANKEGLLVGSACLSSPITSLLIKGDELNARIVVDEFKSQFGDNFFFEIFPHVGLQIQVDMNKKLTQLAKEMDVKTVVSLDVHFKDSSFEEIYLINGRNRRKITQSKAEDPATDCLRQADFHFKDCDCILDALVDQHGLNRSDILAAFDHSIQLDKQINFEYNDYFHLPAYDKDSPHFLMKLLSDKLIEKFGGRGKIPQVYRERLRYEYDIVKERNFSDYFLILWDAIEYCHRMNYKIGAGRGSAGGCLMAYLLGIHQIDPILYNLPFERFLNPYRASFPDIDTDLDSDERNNLIEYLKERWGEHNVVQIITFGEVKAKVALKDVGTYLEIPFKEMNDITKHIPSLDYDDEGVLGDVSLTEALEIPEVQKAQEKHPELFDLALKLEGSIKTTGVHAGGVVVLPKPYQEIVPVSHKRGEDGADVPVVTFDKKQIEKIGLIKYDFLGLSTLKILAECEKMSGKSLKDIPFSDKKTWQYFQKASHMKAVFQFTEPKTCKYLRDSKPANILELSAVNTGIRPGSDWKTYLENKKRNVIKPRYDLPIIRETLKETFGAILYQDDLLFLISNLSDLNLGEADLLRRAFEKNDKKGIDGYREKFVSTCKYQDVASELFEWLQGSVGYLFAKAHAVAYSLNGFYCCYYKANFPEVFVTANILHPKQSNKQTKTEYIYDFIKEAREMGIKIELPKLGNCYERPTLVGKTIYYGISSIKGIGDAAAPILAQTQAETFEEFVDKAQSVKNKNKNGQNTTPVNRGHILRLVKIGFFGDVKEHIKKYNKYFKEEEDPNIDYQDAVNDALDMPWFDPLAKYFNKLPVECQNTDKYLVIKVESEKSGTAKTGRKWRLIKGSSNNGEWSSFNNSLVKGGIYLVRYEKDKDNIKILKEKRLD